MMHIEVVFAQAHQQPLMQLQMPEGCTLWAAVQQSQILATLSAEEIDTLSFGVFSKIEKNPAQRVLHAGDRVEIYRPLLLDPKEARKARADKIRAEKSREVLEKNRARAERNKSETKAEK